MRTVRDAVDRHSVTQPDAPFLLAPESRTTLSYAGLRMTAQALCTELAALGVRPGEVVSYLLPNGVSAASIFLGSMYGGFVVSPISMLAQDALIEHNVAHSETRVIYVAPEFVERLKAIVARIGSRATVRPTSPDGLQLPWISETPAAVVPDGGSPALLMYTSGTTGRPKGALLSHANLMHAGRSVVQAHLLTPADRVLSSLPLYHVNGQCIATISPLVSGGSIVMPHRFSVSQWWSLVDTYRPTWLNVVPTIIAYLINGSDRSAAQATACRGVRFARSASAPLPTEHHRAFEARFGISVLEAMGLTECA